MANFNLRKFIPLLILALFIFLAMILVMTKPSASRYSQPPKAEVLVETQKIQAQPFTMFIESFGTVRPRTESKLIPQVSGQLTEISQNLRDGGFFEKGDVLAVIDPRDYLSQEKLAESDLLQAQLALEEEKARGVQALIDWQRLGDGGEAPSLVLRKPQLAAAEAAVLSAQAKLTQAQLDLERTQIVAPFAGRVLKKNVDVGQVVTSSTELASIYATDYVEIRLPLKNNEISFIQLPESYRYLQQPLQFPEAVITSQLGGEQNWQGKIVRTESAIDENSHQLYVVAQLDDPYGVKAEDKQPLKIGQYVTARIKGKTIENAIVIANASIYQGSYVYIVEEGLLQRREVNVLWQDSQHALIGSGLDDQDELVTTSLGQVSSGTKVRTAGQSENSKGRDAKSGKGANRGEGSRS